MSWAGQASSAVVGGMLQVRLSNFEEWQNELKQEHINFLQVGTTDGSVSATADPSVETLLLTPTTCFHILGSASADGAGTTWNTDVERRRAQLVIDFLTQDMAGQIPPVILGAGQLVPGLAPEGVSLNRPEYYRGVLIKQVAMGTPAPQGTVIQFPTQQIDG
jgi:hypothetical protein